MSEGRTVYVRFRWGRLAVSVGPVGDVWSPKNYKAVSGIEVLSETLGDGLDGILEWPAVAALLEPINLDEVVESFILNQPFAHEAEFWEARK